MSPWDPLVSALPVLGLQILTTVPIFFCGFWGLNINPNAESKSSILPTEPSPSPQSWNVKESFTAWSCEVTLTLLWSKQSFSVWESAVFHWHLGSPLLQSPHLGCHLLSLALHNLPHPAVASELFLLAMIKYSDKSNLSQTGFIFAAVQG